MATLAPLPDLTTLSHPEKNVLIETLHAQVKELWPGNSVRKDSHNYSVPPSADGLNNKKKTRSLRKTSDKSVGGQPGHSGTTLLQTAQSTDIVVHRLPVQCDHCHHPLPLDGASVAARRQVIDITATPREVVKHQILEQVCRCGQVHVSTDNYARVAITRPEKHCSLTQHCTWNLKPPSKVSWKNNYKRKFNEK